MAHVLIGNLDEDGVARLQAAAAATNPSLAHNLPDLVTRAARPSKAVGLSQVAQGREEGAPGLAVLNLYDMREKLP